MWEAIWGEIGVLELVELHYSIIRIILSDNTRINLFAAAHYRLTAGKVLMTDPFINLMLLNLLLL